MKSNTKHALIVGSMLAASGVIYWMYKKKHTVNTTSTTTNSGGTTNVTPNGGGGSTTNGTSALNFGSLSNDLFTAFDGYGTNITTVLNVFNQLKSDSDFDALVAAYGTKTISSGAFNVFVSDFTGNLIGALKSEMDASEIYYINNDILKANGISRQI